MVFIFREPFHILSSLTSVYIFGYYMIDQYRIVPNFKMKEIIIKKNILYF